MNIPSGTVTFLFTEIEDSTKFSQKFPETLQIALEKHHSIMQKAIESNNGFVFEIIGDAFCCAFEKAEDAVKAAVGAQFDLANEKWSDAVIRVRIGIHSGNAEWNNERYMGYITLARTARVMSSAYGEQIIISNNTYELCKYQFEEVNEKAISFRDLGERRLKDVIQPIRLFQIGSKGLREDFPALKTLDARPNNLPIQLTSFIGRESEMKQVKDALKKTRLLTLTGTGGAGKTRFALQVGAEVIDDFANGVWFIELAALSDPSLLDLAVLKVFDLKEGANRIPIDTLCDFLQSKEMLIILDNCEHLVEQSARLAEHLLSKCPELKILATSREALSCSGEQIHIILSLETPNPEDRLTPDKLTQYESVRLFIERAIAVRSDFRVNNNNAPALAQICYQLDGIPLAIELAAARIKILSVEKIYEKLDDKFRLLTGGKRTALPRQQTLKAMIDWSYDLLSEQEKILWRRLSVFSGGWTLEAAEKICSDEEISEDEILDLINYLNEKSIVTYDEVKDRYRILETIKQYGEQRLKELNEAPAVISKFIDYYTEFVETAGPKTELSEALYVLEKLENDHNNFQTAIELSLKNNDKEKGARIAIGLGKFWVIRGHFSAGKRYLKNIIENEEALEESMLGILICSYGNLALFQGEYEDARNSFERSLSLSKKAEDKLGIANSLNGLGCLAFFQGSFHKAGEFYLECLEVNKAADDKRGVAMSLNNLGNVALNIGDIENAKKYYEDSIIIYRLIGNKSQIVNPLHNLGLIEDNQGNYEPAEKFYQESLAISRERGNKRSIANTLLNLGLVAFNLGNNEEAIKLFEECAALFLEMNDRSGTGFSLYGFGLVALTQGKYEDAEKYFRDSLLIRQELGDKSGAVNSLNQLAIVSFQTGNIPDAKEFAEKSLECNKELNDEWAMSVSLVTFAAILTSHNKFCEAVKLLSAVESNLRSIKRVLEAGVEVFKEKQIADLRGKLSDDEFNNCFGEGKKISLDEGVTLAVSS